MDAAKHGAFGWCELMTTDVEAAKRFYAELFGWTIRSHTHDYVEGMGKVEYNVIEAGGTEVGGMMAWPPQDRGNPPYWGVYVTVDDVDAAADKARELGGAIVVPLTDIPGVGRFCVIRDPQGAVISMITEKHDQARAAAPASR